eukprot:Selendium_serpulae@DN3072_c0_g1_i1.p1
MEFKHLHAPDTELLVKGYALEDEAREKMIKQSRDALKWSKQAIYQLHRNQVDEAKLTIEKAKKWFEEQLFPIAKEFPRLRYCGSLSGALEEWCEAAIFYSYRTTSQIMSFGEVKHFVTVEEYMGGLMDFVGEMVRYATAKATERNAEEVCNAATLIDEIMALTIQFDLRNSPLRRKFDTLKYSLKKAEELRYELSLADRMGREVMADTNKREQEPTTIVE